MSYLYDNLKEVLGGDKLVSSRNVLIDGWTPNNVKALVLCRDGIIVVNHMPGSIVKFKPLEIKLVVKDLEEVSNSNFGKPKLNSLLLRRSFSCLEEIYIDTVFMNHPSVVDVLGYVSELTSSISRLRFFGFIDLSGQNSRVVAKFYQDNVRKHGYSLALDKSREGFIKIQYKSTNNDTWYKNYHLRPQYYKQDNDTGSLAMHFRKVESLIEKELADENEKLANGVIESAIKTIVGFDEEYVGYLVRLKNIFKGKGKDSIKDICRSKLQDVLASDKVVFGLSKQHVSCASDILLEFYCNCNVLDRTKGNQIKLKDLNKYLETKKGFLGIPNLLDDFTYEFVKSLKHNGYSDLVGIGIMVCSKELPECKLSREFGFKAGGSSVEGFFSLLSELLGVSV